MLDGARDLPSVGYDPTVPHIITIDGVQISPELIRDAWLREGERQGNIVTFTRRHRPDLQVESLAAQLLAAWEVDGRT